MGVDFVRKRSLGCGVLTDSDFKRELIYIIISVENNPIDLDHHGIDIFLLEILMLMAYSYIRPLIITIIRSSN